MRDVIKENKWLIGTVSAALLSCVMMWEGVEHKPYLDVVGVKTVCYGHTAQGEFDAPIEDREYAEAECQALLVKDIQHHADKTLACVSVPLNVNQHAAISSWAYNVGVGAACNSTVMRRLNAGDYEGACNGLMGWNKAGGKEYRGLTRRRAYERALCLREV
jgi:lysozyme